MTPGMFLAPLLLLRLLSLVAVYYFEGIFLYHIDSLAVDCELSSSVRFIMIAVLQSLCSDQNNLLTGFLRGPLENQLAGLNCGLLRDLPLVPRLVREIVGQDQGHWSWYWHRPRRSEAGDSLEMEKSAME